MNFFILFIILVIPYIAIFQIVFLLLKKIDGTKLYRVILHFSFIFVMAFNILYIFLFGLFIKEFILEFVAYYLLLIPIVWSHDLCFGAYYLFKERKEANSEVSATNGSPP